MRLFLRALGAGIVTSLICTAFSVGVRLVKNGGQVNDINWMNRLWVALVLLVVVTPLVYRSLRKEAPQKI
jgi:hypothetical protein